MIDYKDLLNQRIQKRKKHNLLDVNVKLKDFAIISYAIPINRINKLIPEPFKLWTYFENGHEYALISAVSFRDNGFHFKRLLSFMKFSFSQTNFRTYVVDKRTREQCVWFFGTTLGSMVVNIPNLIWKMPWHKANYKLNIEAEQNRYKEYKVEFESKFGNGKIEIQSCSKEMPLIKGFSSIDEQFFILTHPTTGYYYRKDKKIGTYNIWHPKLELHEGKAKNLYFGLFENLDLQSIEEMQSPHSVLISPKIEFDIYLPPKVLKPTSRKDNESKRKVR